jgi:hypothetical protein
MGGPQLWLLNHELQSRPVAEPCSDGLALMPDDDRDGAWRDAGRGLQHVLDHRQAGYAMKHLRADRLHPRALAGRKDNDVDVRHHL